MREWITIIEQMYIPCRTSEKERQAHIDRIEKHTQEIEWEEARGDEIPPEARRAPEFGTKEWNDEMVWLDYELEKKKREQQLKLRKETIKAQREEDAKIQGIRLAAKDAMDDMIEQDRKLVSKLAQQAIKSSEQSKQRVKKIAQRQLKK